MQGVNDYLEQIMETGVDEMSWDDLSKNEMVWPKVKVKHTHAYIHTHTHIVNEMLWNDLSENHVIWPEEVGNFVGQGTHVYV